MSKSRSTFVRFLALVLACVLTVGMIPISASAYSDGTQRTLYYTMDPNIAINLAIGQVCGTPGHAMIKGGKYTAVYCVNENRGAQNETTGYGQKSWDKTVYSTLKNPSNKNLSAAPIKASVLGTVLANGFQWNAPNQWDCSGGNSNSDKWLVTQLVVWYVLASDDNMAKGKSNSYLYVDPADNLIHFGDIIRNEMKQKVAPRAYNKAGFDKYFETLMTNVINAWKIPSFAVYTKNNLLGDKGAGVAGGKNALKLNSAGEGQWEGSAGDQNGVLGNFKFESASADGVTFTRNGNTLNVTSTRELGEDYSSKEVTFNVRGGKAGIMLWHSPNDYQQNFVTYSNTPDKVGCKIGAKTDGGPGGDPYFPKIKKMSDDGNVAGFKFRITGDDGKTYTLVTDAFGEIDLSGLDLYKVGVGLDKDGNPIQTKIPISYTATEIVPIEYVDNKPGTAPQSFTLCTVEADGTVKGKNVTVTFTNNRKVWRLKFKKHDAQTGATPQGDAQLSGALFGIYKDGSLQWSGYTGSDGTLQTPYFPCGSGYTLQEIDPPYGYLPNDTVFAVGMLPSETISQYNDCNRLEALDGDDRDVIMSRYSAESAARMVSANVEYSMLSLEE